MRLRTTYLALLAATAVLAVGAATASPGSAAQQTLRPTAASPAKVGVRYTIKKFVRQGNRIVAQGTAIGRYAAGSGAVKTFRRPFMAKVAVRGQRLAKGNARPAAAQTICPVLVLTIERVDLNLLGLIVHLDRVHLVITADSEGGVLGSALCGLSRSGRFATQTQQLNWAVAKSGLATNGVGFVVTVRPAVAGEGGNATPNALTPNVICDVLELTLGPLDANLLGLVVHLDTVHLVITADSEGGILGSLFCSVAGGGTAPA